MNTKKTKLFAILFSVVLLLAALAPCVYGADILNDAKGIAGILGVGDDTNADSILGLFGGQGNSSVNLSDLFTNSDGVVDTVRGLLGGAATGVSDSELLGAIQSLVGGGSFDISSLLGGDLLGQLKEYLTGDTGTTATTEEPTLPSEVTTQAPVSTTEPTTEAPSTQEATTKASNNNNNNYSNNSSYTTPTYSYTTTQPAETTTYAYVAPESVTVSPITTDVFSPVVTDEAEGNDGVSVKMIIGIVILVISGAAVIAVAVVLKKTRV